MDNQQELFPKKRLLALLIPLLIEQLLGVTIGAADTIMVTSVGEAAISGVSLVDQINILLIQIFTALASGGAVIAAQYLGRRDTPNANSAAKQLLWLSTMLTLVITAASLIFNNQILSAVYGKIDSDVMINARTYYYITAASYPFLAVYNASAALFRVMGNSRISMFTSLLMNIINLVGNALTIYGMNMGVAGAAVSTFASRLIGAAIMLALICCHRNAGENEIRISRLAHPEFNFDMIKSILKLGIPNGLENGMFQIGKLIVAGLITTFGTAAIAANAICNTLSGFAIIPGAALGIAMITVVGQCVGAKDYVQSVKYTKKLMSYIYMFGGLANIAVFLAAELFVSFFAVSAEATAMSQTILAEYAIWSALIWPLAFSLPNALRAAGDARFTMIVSVFSMWVFRIGCSYLLAEVFHMGLRGVWYGMYIDWIFRAVLFVMRFVRGRWKKIQVID